MAVEVETPEEKMGDVIGDLSSRRGVIQGMEDLPAARRSRPKCRSTRCSLLDPLPLADAGPGDVHDGIQALRRGTEEHRGLDHKKDDKKVRPRTQER